MGNYNYFLKMKDNEMKDSLEHVFDDPIFNNARCVSLPELRIILGNRLQRDVMRTNHARQLMEKSLEYACHFSKITNKQTLIQLREELDRRVEMQDFEVALLLNLHPRTVDEAKTVIPSLQRLDDVYLDEIIKLLDQSRAQN